MNTKIIAFVNFKGGVGKTANVVNIGAALTKYCQRRVLIVDLDAQCNASLWLLQPQQWRELTREIRRSVYQVFYDRVVGTRLFEFEDAVVRGVPRRGYPLLAKLDLLPSVVEMITMEDLIHQNRSAPYETFLFQTLKNHWEAYDYVFLDCPPNLYSVTRNALFAADYCIIPYIPDFLSLSGFKILAQEIHNFYRRQSGRMTARRRPQVAGFIVNHFAQKRKVFDLGVNELKILIDQLKPTGNIHPRADLLYPFIRFNVDIAESTSEHLPVILHDPKSIGAADYADLAQNFLIHFEETLA